MEPSHNFLRFEQFQFVKSPNGAAAMMRLDRLVTYSLISLI